MCTSRYSLNVDSYYKQSYVFNFIITVKLKYRGKIKNTISNILGGVRSSCTYVGAPSLKQLSKCTTFVRVSNQFNETFTK